LKQPTRPKKANGLSDEQKAKAEKDRRNLNIALHHAYKIQNRKEVEAHILDSITALLEFPATDCFTPTEALNFLQLVRNFQPSDFDDLVEERRIDGKCGYALCRQPPRCETMGRSSEWKLKKGMGDWCSDHCAKKGLFIKTQLSEVPAWDREREQQPDVQLHEDDQLPADQTAARRAKRAAAVDDWRKRVADQEELAVERGETSTSFRPNQVMTDGVVEKKVSKAVPQAPDSNIEDILTGGAIEGFQPKLIGRALFSKPQARLDDDEDDD
jgi:hypothetical protein